MPRSQMLERFKQNPRSVLFGTDSFWQGVDVTTARNVITRLLQRARPPTELIEAIRARGGTRSTIFRSLRRSSSSSRLRE